MNLVLDLLGYKNEDLTEIQGIFYLAVGIISFLVLKSLFIVLSNNYRCFLVSKCFSLGTRLTALQETINEINPKNNDIFVRV